MSTKKMRVSDWWMRWGAFSSTGELICVCDSAKEATNLCEQKGEFADLVLVNRMSMVDAASLRGRLVRPKKKRGGK